MTPDEREELEQIKQSIRNGRDVPISAYVRLNALEKKAEKEKS